MYEIIRKKLCIVIQDKIYFKWCTKSGSFCKNGKILRNSEISQIISFINKFCWIITNLIMKVL